ncbi:MAG: T9SS type A sorting domain-containing protein [Candidatus Cloacimonetes bacterium]|nr:T9SS type A sorting domain-containing protein [Candidatus Cloacimonadota bacterium]MDD3235510.1 T9SS type A sorting domain-containing protein [Candidatus Cloacimonadota bacterium]
MKLAVETYPDSALTSLAIDFLFLATRATDKDYTTLKTYLDDNIADEELCIYQRKEEIKTACSIQEKDYLTAINRLQQTVDNPQTVADSLFALIDQAYCYMNLAQFGSKVLPNISIHTPDFQSYISFMLDLSSTLAVSPNTSIALLVLSLDSNYPNPFNPSTTIRFSTPSEEKVKLSIYNINGQKVKELVDENMLAGNHSFIWNETDQSNRKVGSGIYFSRLEYAGKSKLRKMTLLK